MRQEFQWFSSGVFTLFQASYPRRQNRYSQLTRQKDILKFSSQQSAQKGRYFLCTKSFAWICCGKSAKVYKSGFLFSTSLPRRWPQGISTLLMFLVYRPKIFLLWRYLVTIGRPLVVQLPRPLRNKLWIYRFLHPTEYGIQFLHPIDFGMKFIHPTKYGMNVRMILSSDFLARGDVWWHKDESCTKYLQLICYEQFQLWE